MHIVRSSSIVTASIGLISQSPDHTVRDINQVEQCQRTSVAILGAGVAGITAAQTLSKHSFDDFLIVEYKNEIGGRMTHAEFGVHPDGRPYVVELGANWVQGLGSEGGPENPIWTLAKKWDVKNTYSDFDSLLTYNETGEVDYTNHFAAIDGVYSSAEQTAGTILIENLQDRSARAGFSQAGWKPKKDMAAQAVEWWYWDFESANPPDTSSFVFGIAGYNSTHYQYSDENNFVHDERGFNYWLQGEASTFLRPNDTRLLLDTIVTNITYNDRGVTVYNEDGSCISAEYALCTFSLGVLQNEAVTFEPKLPEWKQTGIETFHMGTYTKIFMQFNETFWDAEKQFFLYADPNKRGYYPIFQSLSHENFMPGSNILFVTVVGDESYRIELQDDETTQAEIMEVLRQMFPDITVPKPSAFMFPRWSLEPWAYGSYSNWPVGTTLEMHQNLRANVDRLWFAGEHTSAAYFGFLQGAYFEGREAGLRIASLLGNECVDQGRCGEHSFYDPLHGTTGREAFNIINGWDADSFATYGLNRE
ncbi:putative flavin-containing polyamine oxidase [Patellaria atrata CBS 101060]|uniref:Amine oxidase n=1 Tax=Patellaria atrata CBS 101060 TaxID=1346257 RepID=A0A9P4VRF9_9PEZI|nr:putative flavin-containing polyamine oxidase [Patellaria atrata CBS 101060]